MPVWLICPKCNDRYLADEGAGARCPACGEVVRADSPRPIWLRPLPASRRGRISLRLVLAVVVVSMVVCYTAWMMETIPRDRAAKYDKATCVSNLRCVERAMLMYVEDHGDRLPPAAAWPEGLRRYGADGTALVCPADARERKNVSPRGRRLETSYTQDWRLAGQPFAALGGVADQKVAHFDGLALLGGPEALDPRHNGGVCLGYLDGHVEWRRPADIPPEAWQVP